METWVGKYVGELTCPKCKKVSINPDAVLREGSVQVRCQHCPCTFKWDRRKKKSGKRV